MRITLPAPPYDPTVWKAPYLAAVGGPDGKQHKWKFGRLWIIQLEDEYQLPPSERGGELVLNCADWSLIVHGQTNYIHRNRTRRRWTVAVPGQPLEWATHREASDLWEALCEQRQREAALLEAGSPRLPSLT